MKEQLAVQKILLTKYEELRRKNPQYSRRAFSKKLGLSAGAMSELFNGRRNVSVKLAERIAARLALDPQERSELFAYFPKAKVKREDLIKDDSIGSNYLQLSADQFRVIGEWYHFAILTLMRTKGFKSNAKWFADRLGLSETLVKAAIERLVRLEIIVEKDGKYTRSKARYRTSDDIASSSIRKAHSQYLSKAQEALDTLAVEERDFTSIMMAISPEQMPKAKEMIRKFQDELSAELEKGSQTEVYQFCTQLFPLTKTGAEK